MNEASSSTGRLYANCLQGYRVLRVAKPKGLPEGWRPVSKKPRKPGVYQTSRADIVSFGGSYGRWDGQRWQPYEQWGDYSRASNMVWAPKGTLYGRTS